MMVLKAYKGVDQRGIARGQRRFPPELQAYLHDESCLVPCCHFRLKLKRIDKKGIDRGKAKRCPSELQASLRSSVNWCLVVKAET
eukprot:6254501-Amphidinium_carterae.1